MEEGNLAKWLKKEGDSVTAGDVIAEIETDKATMEVEAVDEGVIGKILVDEGAEGVKVNTPIAVLLQEGESADDIGKVAAAPAAAPEPSAKEEPVQPVQAAAPVAAAPAQPMAAADPDIPAGTEMVPTTVREALRDAMAEEMRRDEDVFVMARKSPNTRAPTRSRRACSTNSARGASSIRRSPSTVLPASASARL